MKLLLGLIFLSNLIFAYPSLTTFRSYPMPSCLPTTFVDQCYGENLCDPKDPNRPDYCYAENAKVITQFAPPLRSTPPIPVTVRNVATAIYYEVYTTHFTDNFLLKQEQKTGIPFSVTPVVLISNSCNITRRFLVFVVSWLCVVL